MCDLGCFILRILHVAVASPFAKMLCFFRLWKPHFCVSYAAYFIISQKWRQRKLNTQNEWRSENHRFLGRTENKRTPSSEWNVFDGRDAFNDANKTKFAMMRPPEKWFVSGRQLEIMQKNICFSSAQNSLHFIHRRLRHHLIFKALFN